MDSTKYKSPFEGRYSSKEMLKIFSADTKYSTWRKLWIALAQAEMELGLEIKPEQITEMKEHIHDIDYDDVAEIEAVINHDVMAHVKSYGKQCPKAAGIIHLGATSCYVTDNADVIIFTEALKLIAEELKQVISNLAAFADRFKDLPTLGYTHLQTAQPVTVGKRATLWIQDFMTDLEDLEYVLSGMKLLGNKGATGTQASFLRLFDGDGDKVVALEKRIVELMGFDKYFPVSGQTYSRKLDSRIINVLSGIAQSATKMANDIRLLQHMGELEEPFTEKQIGSSAMAYKRNPMRSERICSLARYIIADSLNPAITVATQWIERTLDDSANRRISIPEAFLAADAILLLCQDVTANIVVYPKVIERRLRDQLPFIATENILMEAVERGGNRQTLHEVIRVESMEAAKRMKNGEPCGLMEALAANEQIPLTLDEIESTLEPSQYIGRAADQVDDYLRDYVHPKLFSSKKSN